MPNERCLFLAVDYARRLLREGSDPAWVPRALGLDADAVLGLAFRAEDDCRRTRVKLEIEKLARSQSS